MVMRYRGDWRATSSPVTRLYLYRHFSLPADRLPQLTYCRVFKSRMTHQKRGHSHLEVSSSILSALTANRTFAPIVGRTRAIHSAAMPDGGGSVRIGGPSAGEAKKRQRLLLLLLVVGLLLLQKRLTATDRTSLVLPHMPVLAVHYLLACLQFSLATLNRNSFRRSAMNMIWADDFS